MPQPPRLSDDPLPYVDRLAPRDLARVDLVVIHCTELPDLATARQYGERLVYPGSRTGNSGHFYIDRDGSVHRWVPLARTAHHVRGWNHRSIGIELVNRGRYPHWLDSRHQAMDEPYPEPQVAGLLALLQHLWETLPSLQWITGHESLDTTRVPADDDPSTEVQRKLDPGPRFPWEAVRAGLPQARYGVPPGPPGDAAGP